MSKIISKLASDLKSDFKLADEIWVAVGLLNYKGLEFIKNSVSEKCKINFMVGIDLPTEPKALTELLKLKIKRNATANVIIEKRKFFHPKVYILKMGLKMRAYVGSANCTIGGLEENFEMTIKLNDLKICRDLISWFNIDLIPQSQIITTEFIKDYKPKYDTRVKNRKKEKNELAELKEKEVNKSKANIIKKTDFINEMLQFRNSNNYEEYKKERKDIVRRLRKCMDYPNFINIDLKTFFSIRELGTIVAIKVKKNILRNRNKFTLLMKFICDETIPLNNRIDEALNGKNSIENINVGFISKILVIHRPKLYYVHNKAFDNILKLFGLSLPRGISFGEEYEITRNILRQIMQETNINDFATLDRGIWRILENDLYETSF
jgi:HKD family nuclease